MRKTLLLFMLLAAWQHCQSQSDNVGSGRAIFFDGVDDYIDLGNIYDDLQLPFTVSAWVYFEPTAQALYPVLVSQDNAPLYNGFWFCINRTNLFIEYGDGNGDQNPAFRRGKSAQISNYEYRWVYVSAVFKTANDIELYVNGFHVGGTYTGSSTQPMASDYPSDVAKIAYIFQNSVIYRFKGVMDELRVWSRALSENEIRDSMCQRLKGDETGLIGYWNFDETGGDVLRDLSANEYHGVLKGNPSRVFSGAPVGDESVFLYASDWRMQSLSKDDLTVTQVYGSPYGVHIYRVNSPPSQTGGLSSADMQPSYYGVFLAGGSEQNAFDFKFPDKIVCRVFQRKDNSESDWYLSETLTGIPERAEIIPVFEEESLHVDLGDDMMICDQSTLFVEPFPGASAEKTFLWSTGANTPGITVTSSGSYSVQVKESCQVDSDTVVVTLSSTPPAFSLGEDEVTCALEPRVLVPNFETEGLQFTWQDGSTDSTFSVADFGTYWLRVVNDCGVSVDSITFQQKVVKDFIGYNFISPNTDHLNQFFVLDEGLRGSRLTVFNRWGKPVFESSGYHNNWDGEGLPSGIYFYIIAGPCFEAFKGTLTISR